MVAQTIRNKWTEVPSELKVPLIVSAIIHIGLVVLAITGLPYLAKPPEPLNQSAIPIEILPVAELTTTNKIPLKSSKPAPEEPPKTKPPVKKPAPPKVEAVQPPKEIEKPKEPEKEKPKPVESPPEAKLEKPKEVEKPKEKPKVVEKPKPVDAPPPEEKPVDESQQDNFDSLLKNLQDSEPEVAEDLPEAKDADEAAPAPDAPFSQNLTMSELDALRQQLSRCWSIQAGARYAENLVVEVRLNVDRNRRVLSAQVVDQFRYGQDSYFRAAADSAIRAVNSPQCEVLNLNPDKYDLWHDIVVSFDPRDML